MTFTKQVVDSFTARVQAKYLQFKNCFEDELLDDSIMKKLKLQALEAVVAEEQQQNSFDLKPLTKAVNELPRRTIQEQNMTNSLPLNLSSLNSGYLNMTTTKWLKSTLQPLSNDEKIPMPRQLTTFWQLTERAIVQIHSSISLHALSTPAINALGPYILGEAPWLLIKSKLSAHADWDDFKTVVNSIFGKSHVQLRREFMKQVPNPNESSAQFVSRLEVTRSQLNIDESLCVEIFLPQLSLPFQQKCEVLRLLSSQYGSSQELTWSIILNAAKDDLSGASVATYTKHTSEKPNTQTTSSTPTCTQPVNVLQKKPNTEQCAICTSLGIERAFHSPDHCYLNPAGKSFRKEYYDKKISYLNRNNIPIPDVLKIPPPPPTPKTQSSEAVHSFDDLSGFEEYLKKSGMPPHQVASCVDIYRKRLNDTENINMFMDIGTVNPSTTESEGADNLQATYLDQWVATPTKSSTNTQIHTLAEETSPPPKPKPSKKKQLSGLLAAVENLSCELQAAGFDEGSVTGEVNDVNMEQEVQQYPSIVERVSSAVQTGGVRSQGRVISLGPRVPRVRPEIDNGKIIGRLKVSIPLLRSTTHDTKLRSLLLSELLNLEIADGRAVVMPEGMIIHQVQAKVFEEYRKALQGVNASNLQQVNDKLRELGIDGRGQALSKSLTSGVSQGMYEESDPYAAGAFIDHHLMANMCEIDPPLHFSKELPEFADKGAVDGRGIMAIGIKQYIATVQIDNAVTEVVLDTGGHGSIIDQESAITLQLDVTEAVDGNFGHYFSPGYGPRPYAGIVHGPIPIRFSRQAIVTIPFMRVITSPRRLTILGADVLCGGRPTTRWNFASISVATLASGDVKGYIHFTLNSKQEKIALLHVPRIHPRIARSSSPTDDVSVAPPTSTDPPTTKKSVTFGEATEIPSEAPQATTISKDLPLNDLADFMFKKYRESLLMEID